MLEKQAQMQGKICLVTGATSGIGKATALGLARMGANVIVVARNSAKGELARREIQEQSGNSSVDFLSADLSSQASIRQLAETFQQHYDHLDVLINNAGVFMFKRTESVDGLEMTLAVNHLAPFLLTHLLIDALHKSEAARVINVNSGAHAAGKLQLDDLQLRKNYNFWRAYAQSKLAALLCSYEFARRLQGTGITLNSLHPGFVATNIGMSGVVPLVRNAVKPMISLFGLSPEAGARTSLYLATSPDVADTSGKYFVKCIPIRSSPTSYNESLQRTLWDASAQLVHLPAKEESDVSQTSSL